MTKAVTPDAAEYLICKYGKYYRPNAQGYTGNVAEAGRYTLAEAIRHSHPNGPYGPRDGITYELAPPSAGGDEAERAQLIERLRIMAKQRTSSEMDEEDQESGDWQGAYDWFCDKSRAIYAALAPEG